MPRSIEELKARRTICDLFIRALLQPDMAKDPRQPDALEHYKAQLHKLDAELTEAEKLYRQEHGIPEPEPVTVGLKPAKLFGEVRRS